MPTDGTKSFVLRNNKGKSTQEDINTLEQFVFGSTKELEEAFSVKQKRLLIFDDIPSETKAAWTDEDDEECVTLPTDSTILSAFEKKKLKLSTSELEAMLRSKYKHVMGEHHGWAADKKNSNEDESDSEREETFFRHSGKLITGSTRLLSGILDFKKVVDVNKQEKHLKAVTCVQFGTKARIALTGGLDGKLSLFEVDGSANEKLHSFSLENFPLSSACFCNDGNEVVMTSEKRKFFFSYDLLNGKIVQTNNLRDLANENSNLKMLCVSDDGKLIAFVGTGGYIYLTSAKSKEPIKTLKINSDILSVCFNSDSSKLFVSDDEGDVYIFDITQRKCIHTFPDRGSFKGGAITCSTDDRHLVVGSYNGIVNIYKSEDIYSAEPVPVKEITNILTPITIACFNPYSQLLVIGSRFEKNSLRMVHFPSLKVYSNFPENLRKPLSHSSFVSADFSPHSGYLMTGTGSGQAFLYRLKHYESY